MAEVEEEEEASTQLSTLLPPAEVQQRENKAWQDVFDTPANRSAETVGMLLEVRQGCEGPGSRLDGAEKMKGEANSAFEKGEHALALRSYLMALWLLDLDDPPVPKLLAEPFLTNTCVTPWLREAAGVRTCYRYRGFLSTHHPPNLSYYL